MLGSIYVGLSGMNAFSKGLQTISHNVANMNTLGFKATNVTFADVFNVGGLGSSYSGQGARYAGAGVRYESPGLSFRQGDMRSTGNDLDLAVQGAGFLMLNDGEDIYYARTGQFSINDDGYIVSQGTNYRLNIYDGAQRPTPVNVDVKRTSPPVATSKITLDGYVGGVGSTGVSTPPITVYDATGIARSWTVKIAQQTAPNTGWTVSITDAAGAAVGEPQALEFSGAVAVGDTTLDFTYTDSNGDAVTVAVDCSEVQNIAASGGIRGVSDGSAAGVLTQVTINDDGEVELAYSNGETESLGTVVLADFRDPQTLEQIGDGLFRSKGAPPRLGRSDTEGLGKILSGQVEASNVDLSQQFGELILIQRGFQASSQVVSVSNDMIQQLFGIRGQG